MSKRATKRARRNSARARAAGTSNPATRCTCGSWRTPGHEHLTPQGQTCRG